MNGSKAPPPAPRVGEQAAACVGDHEAQGCYARRGPLLRQLDRQGERRLVGRVATTVTALERQRHRPRRG